MRELAGRVAVVTGGGSGIGRGIALSLASEGMHLAIADLDPDSAASVADEIRATGMRASAFSCDVASADSVEALAEGVMGDFGGVHLLCNNAGVHLMAKLDSATEADWSWVFEVNLFGVVHGVRAFLPLLRAQEEAHIVNTASMGGLVPVPRYPIGIYSASKYAVVAFSEALRAELAPDGIGVSVLCPGMVRSNLPSTSARSRPDRHGGPMSDPGPAPPEVEARMLDAEAVGPVVVRGVRANRLYLATHPRQAASVLERAERISADFEAEALECNES